MALNARELLLIVRAQNQASGALRRVGRDLRGLPDNRAIRQARAQAGINVETARAARQNTVNQLESIRHGSRRLANERAILGAQNAQYRTQLQQMRQTRQQIESSSRQIGINRRIQAAAFDAARIEAMRARAVKKAGGEEAFRAQAARRSPTGAPLTRAGMIEFRRAQAQMELASFQGLGAAEGLRMREQLQSARLLRGAMDDLNLRRRIAFARSNELAAQEGRLTHQLAAQTDRVALATEKFRDYDNAISSARWERVAAGGRVLQHFGRVAQYAALVAGGAFAYAANSAAQFQTQATLAATQVANRFGRGAQGTVTATRQISQALLQLMQQSESTSQDLNAAAYDVFSSMTLKGNQRQQITQGMAIMRQFNRAAIAGQANIRDVTHAGITLLNNFAHQGRQVQELPGLLQRMFAAVRFGRMTVTQFTQTLNQLAPAFSAAFGRSPRTFDQLAGALAALSRQMPSVRMASTGLARLTEMFGRRDFVQGLRKFGVAITDNHGRLLPFVEIIDKLNARFPQLAKGGQFLQNFYKTITAAGSTTGTGGTQGTIQGRRALQLLILNAEQLHTVNRQVINDNNEFTKSFQALRQTPAVQWRVFVNVLRSFAITIGTQAIPAITQLARPLINAVKWFNSLSESTKRQIGRWGVYAAAITSAAAAVSFTLGIFIRLFALLGVRLGLFRTSMVVILLAAGAVHYLTGSFDSLQQVIDKLITTTTGSFAGWLGLLTTIAVVVRKVVGAAARGRAAFAEGLTPEATAGLATAGAGAAAGAFDLAEHGAHRAESFAVVGEEGHVFRAIGRMVTMTKTVAQLGKEAIRTRGFFRGMLDTISLIPLQFPIILGLTAFVGVLAYKWKQNLDRVHRAHEAIAKDEERIRTLAAAPIQQANLFGGLPTGVEGIARAGITLRLVRREIADTKKELRGATGRHRSELRDQLLSQTLDLFDAQKQYNNAVKQGNAQFIAFSASVAAVGRNGRALLDMRTHLRELQQLENLSRGFGGRNVVDISELGPRAAAIAKEAGISIHSSLGDLDMYFQATQNHIDTLSISSAQASRVIRRNFGNVIRQLGQIRDIPSNIPTRFVDDMFRLALRRGRMLTVPEIKAFIRAEVDPASFRTANRQIQQAINAGRRQRRVDLHPVVNRRETVKVLGDILGRAPRRTRSQQVALIFSNVVRQAQLGVVNRRAMQVGADIIEGMTIGINQNKQKVYDAVFGVARAAIQRARHTLGAQSPSRVFMQIGNDVIQGLAIGIKNGTPLVRQLSRNLAIDLIPPLKKNQVQTPARLQTQLTGQLSQLRRFNRDIATLQARGVPRGLLAQLAQGGLQNLGVMNQIVNMNSRQLGNYVDTWRQAMAQIDQTTGKTTTKVSDKLKQQRQDVQTAAQNMTQIFSQMRDANVQAFGDITQGVRTQNQLEFGNIPTAQDLTVDLRTQVRTFERWRNELEQLGRRGFPPALISQLQQQGPQAEPIIRGLLHMNTRQVRQYTRIFRRGQRDIQQATRVDFNAQLAQWRSHGRKAARLFMLGMRDENSYITAQMRRIFLNFLRGRGNARLPRGEVHHHVHHHKHDDSLTVVNPKEDLRTTQRKHDHHKRVRRRHRTR